MVTKTALVVDDEILVLASTSRLVRCLGYEITEAKNGREASRVLFGVDNIHEYETLPQVLWIPDVCVFDYAMVSSQGPRPTGLDLVVAINMANIIHLSKVVLYSANVYGVFPWDRDKNLNSLVKSIGAKYFQKPASIMLKEYLDER